MKSLFKNVNTFGLMGVLLAGGLVFTQSAFTPAKSGKAVDQIYGYDPNNNLQHWTPNNTPGYNCEAGSSICKYSFSTPPNNSTQPSEGTPRPLLGLGVYQ